MTHAVAVRSAWTAMSGRIRARLQRPPEMLESTRWLFAFLALASLVLTLPEAVATADGAARFVVVACVLVLAASWRFVYVRRSAPVALDLVETAAIAIFAIASPLRSAALGFVFPALLFRSMYGSTRRAMLRCLLYAAALAVGLPRGGFDLVSSITERLGPALGVVPMMVVTVVISRHLAANLQARERAARRDAVHVTVGSELLGVTNETEIRRIAWVGIAGICAVTPGLRVLKVVREQGAWRVERATGESVSASTSLPAALPSTTDGSEPGAGSQLALDGLIGAHAAWAFVPLPDMRNQPEGSGLLLVAPHRVSPDAVTSISSLANQVSLALRNSEVHQELTLLATLDSLTGLANRATFYTAVAAALEGSGTAGTAEADETTVLFVDLDDFKDVNDLFGHGAGDDLLREIADRLRRATRPDDLCARLGGDEFAVLLRHTGSAVAAEVARRIIRTVAVPAHLRGGMATVGASVGVATAAGSIGLEQLIHHADIAMYAAKAKGKARLQLFDPALLRAEATPQSFETQLAGAAKGGELVLHYQPVLSLPELRCTAVEALVRWRHPERGVLFPDSFVELAEQIGAIRDIGTYVLRRACSDAAGWRAAHPELDLAVHVNVSGLQLDDDWFLESVQQCLADFDVPAAQLVLEITETVVISSPAAIARLHALSAVGVTIAIDDFGTGYSALTTLRSLPVRIVKIDKSFVAASSLNHEDRTVTEAVVQMARQMGMRTIAEGVSRLDQQQFLDAIGADAVQGFLYQHPIDAAELGGWLDAHAAGLAPVRAAEDNVVPLHPRQTA